MISKKEDADIERQWKEWTQLNDPDTFEDIDSEELKDLIIRDLTFVNQMEVNEYLLYQKWFSMQKLFPAHTMRTLYGVERQLVDINEKFEIEAVKNNIWTPKDPEEYLDLKPILIHSDEQEYKNVVSKLCLFLSSGERGHNNIGRNLGYIIADEVTGKYLGVNMLSSDYLDLAARDKYIGWDKKLKTMEKINHTCVGSRIVPTQPLGFNYTGGKLCALMCLADPVQERWKEKYGDVLVGVTTTSFFGKAKAHGLSQYDGLKHWKKMGYSKGSVSFEPNKDTIQLIVKWLKKNHTRKYFEWYHAQNAQGQPYKRDHRNRSYSFTYSKLGVPRNLVSTFHQRGIYFAPLYKNTNEYLRGEISEDQLVKEIDTSVDALANLWKEKYAKKRINSLIKQDRVSSEGLFYDELLYMNWEETKERYLGDIGR